MIADLSLAVALWMVGGGESEGDFVLGAETHHLPAREVGPIIRDDDMWKSKAAHNILPEEFKNLLPYYVEER